MTYDSSALATGFATRERAQRTYIGTTLGLTVISLLVMCLEAWWLYSGAGHAWMIENPQAFDTMTIICLVASIVGIILGIIGRRQIGFAIASYTILTLSLGFTTASILVNYDVGSIVDALSLTLIYTAVMCGLGFAFPDFFRKISGVLLGALIGLIVAQIVGFFIHFDQTLLNWGVLLVFGGFIAFDTYQAANDYPTLENALFWSVELYLDIINILIRILAIMGNSRDD